MNENKSQHWSVGLPLVQWGMNTQTHKGIGGKILYHLFTGQDPCVGISSLPIDPELIKKLSTEVQVSALLDLDPDIPLEDAVVRSYQSARWQPAMVALPPGMVQANVGQNVTPPNPLLGLFLYHFLHMMSS
jgi:hypothetical protein